MKSLEKKQIPQVIGLAVLAIAFFAYFAAKLILPTPAAAKSQLPPALATAPISAAGTRVVPTPAVAADTPLTAPPPGPGMRDPFVPAIVDPATAPHAPVPAVRTASIKGPGEVSPLTVAPLPFPSVQALPPARNSRFIPGAKGPAAISSGLAPLPVAPPPPAWTVTGVLQSGGEHIAILRDGEARRFVKQGDFVDNEYKVVLVTRETVILGHGAIRFVLPLGGAKPAPVGRGKPAIAVPSAPPLPSTTQGAVISRAVIHSSVPPRKVVTARVFNFPDYAAHYNWRRIAMTAGMARLPKRIFAPRIAVRHPSLTAPDLQVAALLMPPKKLTVKKLATVRVADYLSTSVRDNAPITSPRGMLTLGTLAPDFSLSTLDGQTLTLSQFQGHPVLLNFWASWDVQSTHMMSSLASLQSEFSDQGLAVVSVNTWDNEESLRAFLSGQDFGKVVVLFDPSVSNDSLAVRLYKVPDIPALYLIDSEGRIAAAFVGHGRNTTSAIKAALAKIDVR